MVFKRGNIPWNKNKPWDDITKEKISKSNIGKQSKHRIDLTGQKFGKWTVLQYSNCVPGATFWICQCECGKISLIASNDLRYGNTTCCKDCGINKMKDTLSELNTIDETGNRYGRLLVIEQVESDKNNQARWKCICDCGKETIVHGGSLRKGATRSCGCLRKEYMQSDLSPMKRPEVVAKFKGKLNPSYGIVQHSKGEWYPLPNWSTFWIRSSYEKRVIYMLLMSNTKFIYEPCTFDLGEHTYTPDIYLPEYDLWWEVKGYLRPREKIKMIDFIKKYNYINLKMIIDKDINQMQEDIIQNHLNIKDMGVSLEEYLIINGV